MPLATIGAWNQHGIDSGLTDAPGIYGNNSHWDLVAYGVGDVDGEVMTDTLADTWLIASVDGSRSNVMGLPVGEVVPALVELGVERRSAADGL